jgi:hypothetical protein
MKFNSLLTGWLLLCLVSACASQEPGMYRNGALVRPAPLGLNKSISFRFVDKWRVSHKWLVGPTEIRGCWSEGEPFRYGAVPEALKSEKGTAIGERDNRLHRLGVHQGEFFWYRHDELFYGTPTRKGRENEFNGYSALCLHYFRDTLDGVGIYLIKPDPAKGTDEWIRGAEPVTVNGLRWLRKAEPIKDWWPTRKEIRRDSGPVETWVLQIPDTPYWFSLHLASGTGETSPFKVGSFHYPEKHRQIVDLFHQMIESVVLEPIEPVEIPATIKLLR